MIMITLKEISQILQAKRDYLRDSYYVAQLGVFGSCARGDAREMSDIDILVEFSRRVDFIKFLQLESYLSDILGGRVDLVTKKALKPLIKDKVLKQTVYL